MHLSICLKPNSTSRLLLHAALGLALTASTARAQTTTFAYQGKLTDGGTPANGNYDLQFALWDSAVGGTQIGSTQTVFSVSVNGGTFTVTLDFGADAFPGADRFLEISARASGGSPFTLLSPRQQLTSTPYAVRSLNSAAADALSAACGGCVSDANIGGLAGSKINGAIPVPSVPAGSGNYIQNTNSPQAGANFNISGDGTAGGTLSGKVVNATTQYNLGGSAFASAPSNNTMVGFGTGQRTTGFSNSFFGYGAGGVNTADSDNSFFGALAGAGNTSSRNSFFGSLAGENNRMGGNNAFFGYGAGVSNTDGSENSFFGTGAGSLNTMGEFNSFFGAFAGENNVTGADNAFFGPGAGVGNTSGANNTFVGVSAGQSNTTESLNTFIGAHALGAGGITNATAIGASAQVTRSNSLVLGSINNVNFAIADTKVGIGTTAPVDLLHVVGHGTAIRVTDGAISTRLFSASSTGNGYVGTASASPFVLRTGDIDRVIIDASGNVGIGTGPDHTLSVNGNADKPGGGSWDNLSDERLKTIRGRFTPGLKALRQLQPLRYEYKRDNALGIKSDGEHIGFGAQSVQKAIPEAVTRNDKGYLLVNNDPIIWTMLNAIKEQQKEIEQLKQQVGQLQAAAHRQRVRRR